MYQTYSNENTLKMLVLMQMSLNVESDNWKSMSYVCMDPGMADSENVVNAVDGILEAQQQ